MQVHQLLPALHQGDAIGDSARALRDFLRTKGFDSRIYSYTIDEEVASEALPFQTSVPQLEAHDVLILHFALPSGMTDFLKDAPCRKAIIYHNVTPADYWLPYDRVLVHLAVEARKQLKTLSTVVERSAGDSEFNRQELEELGFRNTCVLPIFVPFERYKTQPSEWVRRLLQDDFFSFLAVGRIAPNKKLEDVLRLYYFFKKLYNPLSRVIFVGKTSVVPAYYSALKDLASRYGLLPEDVLFTGHVDWSELVAYYRNADVFVSMSEHEGFCVPLVEAMICNTPIVAYSSTAVPYTLGEAGIQFEKKDFPEIAGVCHSLTRDVAFRDSILDTQRKQLIKYSRKEIEKAIETFMEPLLCL